MKKGLRWLRIAWCLLFSKEYDFEEASRRQDEVMSSYKDSGAVNLPAEEEALHMFFSPSRVPSGMTNEEVRICIVLYQLRCWQRDIQRTEEGSLARIMRPIYLPYDLTVDKPMTRRRFNRGINKFLRTL